MSARAARRTRQPEVVANSHRRSNQLSREQLYRENERLLRENEELRRKVAERESQIAEHEKQIADADKQIADAEKQIADAEKQIADLERQLAGRKKNSTNSSKPPSSDGLAGEQRPRGRKHKSKRKPGAQPGHPGHHRPLVPSAAASAIEVLLPQQCEHCGASLPQEPGKVPKGNLKGRQTLFMSAYALGEKQLLRDHAFSQFLCVLHELTVEIFEWY